MFPLKVPLVPFHRYTLSIKSSLHRGPMLQVPPRPPPLDWTSLDAWWETFFFLFMLHRYFTTLFVVSRVISPFSPRRISLFLLVHFSAVEAIFRVIIPFSFSLTTWPLPCSVCFSCFCFGVFLSVPSLAFLFNPSVKNSPLALYYAVVRVGTFPPPLMCLVLSFSRFTVNCRCPSFSG